MAEEQQKSRHPSWWPKGVSGNPGGRRKGTSVTALLRAALDEGGAEKLAEVILARASDGDSKLIQILLDRAEGPVRQDLHLSGSLSLSDAASTILRDVDQEPEV